MRFLFRGAQLGVGAGGQPVARIVAVGFGHDVARVDHLLQPAGRILGALRHPGARIGALGERIHAVVFAAGLLTERIEDRHAPTDVVVAIARRVPQRVGDLGEIARAVVGVLGLVGQRLT